MRKIVLTGLIIATIIGLASISSNIPLSPHQNYILSALATNNPTPPLSTPTLKDGNQSSDAGGDPGSAMILTTPRTYSGDIGYLMDSVDCYNISVPGPGYTIYVSLDLENVTPGGEDYMSTLVLSLLAPNGTMVVNNTAAYYHVEHRLGLVYTLTNGDPSNKYWTIRIAESGSAYCDYWLCFNTSANDAMTRPTANWTFIAYLDADCNLGMMAMNVLAAMAGAGSTSNVNIIAMIDHSDPSSDYNYTLQEGTWVYYVYKEGLVWLSDYGCSELNMGDPDTLKNFINYAKQHFPAQHYALNTWDHGGGIFGVCWDNSSNEDNLEYDEILQALNESGGVDVLFYFSCLTGTFENFYTISSVANVAVASEEAISALGDYYVFYMDFLENLTQNPSASPSQLGGWIVDAYDQRYTHSGKTMAAVDLSKMGELYAALNETAKLLDIQTLDTTWKEKMLQAVNDTEKYYNYSDYGLVDLYDLMSQLASKINDQWLQTLTSNVKNNVTTSIIKEVHGASHLNSHGIAIYHPNESSSLYSYYDNMSFASSIMWDEYLHHFFNPQEHNYLDYDSDGLNNTREWELGTDASSSDTDGDGMPDGWEAQHGFNPLSEDSGQDPDNDGLSNLQEYQHGTDPQSDDTDGDGMPDGWEVQYGLNPTSFDPFDDPDNDGLNNLQEYQYGTDPRSSDTDGDGLPDGWEVEHGFNPASNDFPLLALMLLASLKPNSSLILALVAGVAAVAAVVGIIVGRRIISKRRLSDETSGEPPMEWSPSEQG